MKYLVKNKCMGNNLVSNTNLKSILTEFLNRVKEMIPVVKSNVNADSLEVKGNTETAMGSFNASSDDTLLSVGNGTSEENRSNAFEIKENGDIYITKHETAETIILQSLLAEPIPVEDIEGLN